MIVNIQVDFLREVDVAVVDQGAEAMLDGLHLLKVFVIYG